MKKIAYIFIFLSFFSCKTETNFSDEIKEIEQLQKKLNKAENDFVSIDTSKTQKDLNIALENIRIIKNKYITDKVDIKMANLMNAYKIIKHAGKDFTKGRKQIWKELVF